MNLHRDHAAALDAGDPLAAFREQFHLPQTAHGAPARYFCGHSLGLQPCTAAALVDEELQRWKEWGVEGHFRGDRPWLSYHELLTPGLGELAGALPVEVVAMNSLSVNLHLMLTSFYRPTATRFKILVERGAFPSDRYAATSCLHLHGHDPNTALLQIAPRSGESTLRNADILTLIEREGAVIATVLLPGVQYLTGQLLDMQAITAAAQAQGCTVGFDLAHAIGNVPLNLHGWNTDFAVWCSYKYLNAGPGAIGGCFVHERHAHGLELPRLAGWWGHDKRTRFAMPDDFQPLPGAQGWQLSNPSILASAPLLASLRIFQQAGLMRLREKSLRLSGYLEGLLRERLAAKVELLTPSRPECRGAQQSLRLRCSRERALQVHRRLGERGIICDWREPDIIRVAPVPLYNSFGEVWELCQALVEELS